MKELFRNGKIITMADPLYTEAVLVEDGTILAVGTEGELRKLAGSCHETDLNGAVLAPAFIDPHSHFFQTAYSLLQVSMDGAENPAEMGRRVQEFIREKNIPAGEWINARDYDNNLMEGYRNPGLQELDKMAPDHPLIIHHKSGHMGLLNSRALAQIGITADTPSPQGGKIETENGRLTGYLEENAFFEAVEKIPMPGLEQFLEAFQGAQQLYASYGITTVQDGMVVDQMLPLYEVLLQKNLLHLDIRLYSGLQTYDNTCALLEKYPDQKHLKSAGMKMFLDGSPQGRTAWMREPYLGAEDGYSGYPTMTDAEVEDAFGQAARKQTQIIAHCNGDAAAEQFLRCLQQAEQKYPVLKELRPVIIHGQLMGKDQLPRAAELGAMISFFVAHVYHWGDVHIRNFGMERAAHISPAASAMKAGINVTFHQDTPVIPSDMLETIWCAVSRETKAGVQLAESEAVSPLDALRAVTVNAAVQYGEQDRKGSIEPGKNADFVLLNADPLQIPKTLLRNIRVLRTYQGGECIFSRR